MTDQIELPSVPQSPPVITLMGYDDGEAVIKFDRELHNELVVDLSIRDEDLTETLEARWRIVSRERPPGTDKLYPCEEPKIVGKGTLNRSHRLTLLGSSFARGKCSRVDVIVSANFKSCRPDRDDGWDVTTLQDDEADKADIGRLSFWVWVFDASSNPLLSQEAALMLTMSCPATDYQPPSATASETSAATGL